MSFYFLEQKSQQIKKTHWTFAVPLCWLLKSECCLRNNLCAIFFIKHIKRKFSMKNANIYKNTFLYTNNTEMKSEQLCNKSVCFIRQQLLSTLWCNNGSEKTQVEKEREKRKNKTIIKFLLLVLTYDLVELLSVIVVFTFIFVFQPPACFHNFSSSLCHILKLFFRMCVSRY